MAAKLIGLARTSSLLKGAQALKQTPSQIFSKNITTTTCYKHSKDSPMLGNVDTKTRSLEIGRGTSRPTQYMSAEYDLKTGDEGNSLSDKISGALSSDITPMNLKLDFRQNTSVQNMVNVNTDTKSLTEALDEDNNAWQMILGSRYQETETEEAGSRDAPIGLNWLIQETEREEAESRDTMIGFNWLVEETGTDEAVSVVGFNWRNQETEAEEVESRATLAGFYWRTQKTETE